MRTKIANWTRLAVVVVAMAGTQTGCKSGWKMPGTDMFPWSKKPSESTLAGTSPSLSMPPSSSTSPVGPAYRNTPSPLSSTAANSGRTASPYGPTSTTGPSFNMPPNNPMASSQMASNGAGIAAGANGYSTGGQYNMAANAGRPGFTPPSGYGPPPQTANSFNNAPPANPLAGMPPAYGGMAAGQQQAPSISGYAPMGNSGIPALPANYNPGANASGSMPAQSSMPNALPGGFPPSSPTGQPVAAQSYSGASPYSPGSVGRKTSYDFSSQGAGTSGATPNNVPNTANGMPNGLPPNVPGGMYR